MNALNEFVLMARFKGELPIDPDEYYHPHLVLHLQAEVVLGDAEEKRAAFECLAELGAACDEDLIHELIGKWRGEFFGARTFSLGGRGRRPDAEMDYIRFHLYLLTAQEKPATVRSIYYRAVSKGIVPKTDSGYRTVQQQLLAMRRKGLLPWGWITDASRRVWGRRRFKTLKEYAEHVASNYYADYWADAEHKVEVWCEKDAMYGVLAPVVVEKYGLNLYVSKGQASSSYLYEAAQEIIEDGRPTTVYILSDFDPGGFKIAEKIEEGLREHVGDALPITAHRIAVTHEQILDPALDIPTREVKKSDKNAPAFMERYGDVSAELEAIPSHTLREMVRQRLEGHIAPDRLKVLKLAEEEERKGLVQLEALIGRGAA